MRPGDERILDPIADDAHPLGRHAVAHQLGSDVLAGRDGVIGEPGQTRVQRTPHGHGPRARQADPVVGQLAGQGRVRIVDERHAAQALRRPGGEQAFVMMRVNDVDRVVAHDASDLGREHRQHAGQPERIGTGRGAPVERQASTPVHLERQLAIEITDRIGDDMNRMTRLVQCARHAEDARRRATRPGKGAAGNERYSQPPSPSHRRHLNTQKTSCPPPTVSGHLAGTEIPTSAKS